ncbi:hypothetical protein BIW11_10658 [Tropilaelaps mercedesae]|uniref:Uncharacterized protein n=1 Tax=Tropilaelaps mercedesae TaxID=418985 RepID=A0A1V9XF02_9ACAR|nr:hypothetical protein BIW11_10658 [Tropilaelaps mercedesae]
MATKCSFSGKILYPWIKTKFRWKFIIKTLQYSDKHTSHILKPLLFLCPNGVKADTSNHCVVNTASIEATMTDKLLETQVADLDNEWSFCSLFAGNGAQAAVVISIIIQVILGIVLYMEGDFVGTGILCTPTLLALPIIAYIHIQRMKETRIKMQALKTLRSDGIGREVVPESGDKPHEKEE